MANSTMTARDFIALADTIRHTSPPPAVVDALVDFCRSRNSRFDETCWRNYLAGTGGPRPKRKPGRRNSWQENVPAVSCN